MNKQITTGLAIAVIIIIAGILGGIIYFERMNDNSSSNISELKQAPTAKEQDKITNETSTPSNSNKIQEISFGKCGTADEHKSQAWYPNFIRSLSKFVANLNDKDILETGIFNVSGMCLSLDKTTLIAITSGGYCEAGSLFKYDIPGNVLTKAVFNDHGRGCVSWPSEFGKIAGNIMSLQGSGGDAGCGNTMYYEYNFVDNKIELKKENDKCDEDKQGTWINY